MGGLNVALELMAVRHFGSSAAFDSPPAHPTRSVHALLTGRAAASPGFLQSQVPPFQALVKVWFQRLHQAAGGHAAARGALGLQAFQAWPPRWLQAHPLT